MSKIQPTTTKLSDTQLVILGSAAQRDDGSILPFPETLTVKGAALSKVIGTHAIDSWSKKCKSAMARSSGAMMKSAVP